MMLVTYDVSLIFILLAHCLACTDKYVEYDVRIQSANEREYARLY
jgi:hypothetical protein